MAKVRNVEAMSYKLKADRMTEYVLKNDNGDYDDGDNNNNL
jgi:hypothetical protein